MNSHRKHFTNNITNEKVVGKLRSFISESCCDISNVLNQSAYRIGKSFLESKSNSSWRSIIVQCATFRHRNMLHWNRNKLKKIKVKLDLTKKRYTAKWML